MAPLAFQRKTRKLTSACYWLTDQVKENLMPSDVVVIGAGGIGQAIARRQGAGRTVLLADHSEPVLAAAKEALEAGGHVVSAQQADASSRESVRALARTAAGLGAVVNVVNRRAVPPLRHCPRRFSPST
jgi:NAD(P)-dependent dehydrogenase (short-subunit alcohol dehydrogenase family)